MCNVCWALFCALTFFNFLQPILADELKPDDFKRHNLEFNVDKSARESCENSAPTNDPPFDLTTLEKNMDEQMPGKPKHRKKSKKGIPQKAMMTGVLNKNTRIPAMTLVFVPSSVNFEKCLNPDGVPVQVVSVPEEAAITEMNTAPQTMVRAAAGNLARPGDKGRLPAGQLLQIDKYVFKVKTETNLIKFSPDIESLLRNSVIRFTDKNGQYLAKMCCSASPTNKAKHNCHKEYEFEVLDENDPTQVLAKGFDNTKCDFMSLLNPLAADQLQALVEMKQLSQKINARSNPEQSQSFDTRGLKKPELTKIRPEGSLIVPPPADSKLASDFAELDYGPANTLHYKTDSFKKDTNNNNIYAHPVSQCAFFKAVDAFNAECDHPGCRVQWGDWYTNNLVPSHAGHKSGSCVDIRPLRKSEGYTGLVFGKCPLNPKNKHCHYNKDYDGKMMKILVNNYLQPAGGVGNDVDGYIASEPVYFNDTAGIEDVKHFEGHSDHLHVCFPPKEKKVQETCNNGFKKK